MEVQLDWIMAIAQLCQTAVAAGKTLIDWKDSALSEREKELLRSAAQDGMFHTACSDWYGRHVVTSKRAFGESDPAITAHYLDAFIGLCEKGLIIHQAGTAFRLTGKGFDLARKFASAIQ